ncbi:MAG: DUF1080 domain-containing protein [Planctomycetales bacterium]|nr:DUF1080 domain-containing protein [Planctomycetales bacterium]
MNITYKANCRSAWLSVMRSLCTLLVVGGVCAALFAMPATAPAAEAPEGFTSLFDGRSLAGWEGNEQSFRVENGCIVGGTLKEKIPRNEFLCTTKEYENFELRLKVKAIGQGVNAGVQFRTKRIPNHHEVSGYQADVGQGWWGKLYDESRRRKVLAGIDEKEISPVVKLEDWNDYVIRCEGSHIQLWLNGLKTVDYVEQEEGIDRRGIIAVQIHGGAPSEAWYKDIVIKELPQ